MTITLHRTTADDPDFQRLLPALDAELAVVNGDQDDFYRQFNVTETMKQVVVLTADGQSVATGAFKRYDERTAEIKRMFVLPKLRGQRLGERVIRELECWAGELGYRRFILETSIDLHSAIRLYTRCGYRRMPRCYGQYVGKPLSYCMEKYKHEGL